MEFKQYPSYKDSGVEWLGDVPEGWELYPFWHLFKRKEITNKTEEQLLSVYLDRGVILHSEGGGMVHKPAESLEKYQLVEVNDFVMNNQQAWRGSVGVSPHQGIVSPAYLIFKPNKELNSQFSKYQLRDKYLVDQFMISSLSVGTIQRQIKNHLLRVIQVATPPLDDQQKIVSFLDTETARIDNLISKQEKLIKLLEEQRKSIISYAVTKGLNPNAPMKDSGVEWLGEVPEHWDVYPFWHLFKQKEITNKTKEKLLSVYLDRGVILHSEGGGMVHKPAENLEKYQLVEVNDFVMNNQQAWRGSVGVSPHQGIVSPAYLIFKPNKELNPQFSKYQLRDKYIIDQFMISSLSVGTIQRQIKNHLLN
jgi:type I restriction enzyme S subunit